MKIDETNIFCRITYCAFATLDSLKCIVDMTTNTSCGTVNPTGFGPITAAMYNTMNLWFLNKRFINTRRRKMNTYGY
jgi:hypothetical protein